MKLNKTLPVLLILFILACPLFASTWGQFVWSGHHHAQALSVVLEEETLSQDTVKSNALVYPNPFSLKDYPHTVPKIYYWLDNAQDIEIHLYDQLGKCLFEVSKTAASSGAKEGVNYLSLNKEIIDLRYLSPSTYFFIIISKSDQKILFKGELALWP